MALTDAWLKANLNKSSEKTYVRSDRDGLGVRVTPKGKLIFQFRYYFLKQARRLDLGEYPQVSLKVARGRVIELKGALAEGRDPREHLRVLLGQVEEFRTVNELFGLWFEKYCAVEKKGAKEIKRSFEIHVLPTLGNRSLERVQLHDWLAILEDLSQRFPGIGHRVLTNAKQMYKWGVKRKLVEHNPLADINAAEDLRIKKKAGSRVLSLEEIQKIWLAMHRSRMSPKNVLFLKLCLLYGCRGGELRLARKSDLDFKAKVWTVPPENHKTGKATGKPLKRPIIDISFDWFKEASKLSGRQQWLFLNEASNDPMGKGVPLALPYNIMQWLRRHEGYEMSHWSVHDLRRTARTNFSTLTEPHIAEIMLGHKLPGQWMVYDQHDYLEEQREAYEKWWGRLQEITQ